MKIDVKTPMLLLLLVALHAPIAHASSQISADKTITEIRQYENYAVVRFSPAQSNAEGCSNGGDTRAIIEWNSWNDVMDAKLLFATIMTAYVTGKPVGFGVSGCFIDFPEIYRVDAK